MSPGASKEAIQHHYDVGNDFYALWLDEQLNYSCALWDGVETLDQAQRSKLEYHAERARAKDAARVLDVGCGWGAMLQHLVDRCGVQSAVGLTLSEAQQTYIQRRGDPRLSVRLEPWADHRPAELYDAVISIGAFEHFATFVSESEKVASYRQFFERCHAWTRAGSWLSLQTIAYGTTTRDDYSEFIKGTIFPESDLPRLEEIARASFRLYEIVQVDNHRKDYERTCREWLRRLVARREQATALVGPTVVANYEQYLKLSMIGFFTGRIQLLRLSLRRL